MPATQARQLVIFSGEVLRVYELPSEGSVTIGRAEGNAVRLDEPSVSRHHAVLHMGPTIVLEDLGGQNGTFLRDHSHADSPTETQGVKQLVRRRVEVTVGDRLIFGTVGTVLRHAPIREIPCLGAAAAERSGVVLESEVMRDLYEQAARAARSNMSVLLFGETGVGKDVLAHAIHAHSRRAGAPFMSINCAALSETLLESELFGHEKGAFTGALQARAGLLEAASPGTVFLDEVGELSSAMQAKLLRVVEDKVVMRVGATKGRPIDVRFIAATNRNLEQAVETGAFRSDLYFRLNGIALTIPPLRERREEITVLARVFLEKTQTELERPRPLALSQQALNALLAYDWPGNVRELRNVIERLAVLCPTDTILVEHLPSAIGRAVTKSADARPSSPAGLSPAAAKEAVTARYQAELRAAERARVEEALARAGGNQTRAAELLGMSRRTLVSRLADLAIERPRKRAGH